MKNVVRSGAHTYGYLLIIATIITVFAALTTIGVSAVEFDTNYYEYNGEVGVTITGFNNLSDRELVTIPAEIDGKPVLALGLEGALECIPGAKNIVWLDLTKADNLKVINQYAFYYCTDLCGTYEYTIESNTVEKVEKSAFEGCDSIKGIKLDNCIAVGDYAFKAWYGEREYYDRSSKTCCTKLTYFSSLEKVDLPNCKTVGTGAFIHCESLKEVNLPNVELIKLDTFIKCIRLETVNLNACMRIDAGAFYNCHRLNSVTVAKDCDIDKYAFRNGGYFGKDDVTRV